MGLVQALDSVDVVSCETEVSTGLDSVLAVELEMTEAEADTKRYQATAEQRRALAVALAAEHRAEVEKNRALVVLAEAEIPKAMAESFRSGNMGIMDFYRMKNIMADTDMRGAIAEGGPPSGESESKG